MSTDQSRIRQSDVHSEGSQIDDTVDPTQHDLTAANLADTVDAICSQIRNVTGKPGWEFPPDFSLGDHENLDTLTHDLTETHDVVPTRDGQGRLQEVLWVGPPPNNFPIRRLEILTRTPSKKIDTFRVTQYGPDGITVLRELSGTVLRLPGGKVERVEIERTV